jgi:ABC-2 type transport system ATP-binding protein
VTQEDSVTTPDGENSTRAVVLRTEGLAKRFGQRMAVNGLDLEVRRGDVYGLLGPNGSGKTTTIRMVLGLVWPTAGTISLFGEAMTHADARRRALQRVGAIVEQPAFYPFLSGRDNLLGVATFAGLAGGSSLRAHIDEMLALVGLATFARQAYRKYSLGMKQRLGIAAALLTNPDMVILDEPTNGLDPVGMVEVRRLIGRLAERGVTVVLSSHLLHEVQQVCTRVGIINNGRLIAQGDVRTLMGQEAGIELGFDSVEHAKEAASILDEAARSSAPWIHGMEWVAPRPGSWTPPGGWLLRVRARDDQAAKINELLAARGLYASELRHHETSLEQLFLTLTGGASSDREPLPAVAAVAAGGAGTTPEGEAR